MYDRRHNNDNHRLQRERRDERGAPQWTGIPSEAREEKAAEAETDDGRQGLGPAVWLRGCPRGGRAEAYEDCISSLHADKRAVGVVDCAVDEAGDEAAGQHNEVCVVGVDLLPEVGA